MISSNLPRFVRDLLAACPTAGDGVHNWLFRIARLLHYFYQDKGELARLIESAAGGCGRVIPAAEIADAIANSEAHAWQPGKGSNHQTGHTAPKWPAPDLGQIESICSTGPKLVDLWELSPIRFIDNNRHTEEIVDEIFPGDPLLCVGLNKHDFRTNHRNALRGMLQDCALIVPSPMTAPTGLTKGGKVSEHALANTGLRRFLVVETDFAEYARDGKSETIYTPLIRKLAKIGRDPIDMSAAVLAHLAGCAPLALATHSGKKSMHGWFYCEGQEEVLIKKFMDRAVIIGADRATWTRSQFVRMPDGTRDNGKRQTVYPGFPRFALQINVIQIH